MLSLLSGITVVLLVAFLIAIALRKSSAGVRHLVWTCGIAATLCLGPLRWATPQHPIHQPLPLIFEPVQLAVVSTPPPAQHTAPRPHTAFGLSEIALTLWLFGSLLLAVRYASRAWQFRQLTADAQQIDRPFPIPILLSRRIPGPLVAGILRPKIMLPSDSSTWPPHRVRAVLAHELAHIRRRDPAILLLAEIATIVYWFHPLCWLAAARLRRESELACDDAALRVGLRPSSYAGELLELARLFNPQPAIPMAATSHLESRVKSILDPYVNRSFAARRAWMAAVLMTAVLCVPLTVFSLKAQAPDPATGGGTISGTVTDPTGAVVARAQVTASNLGNGNKEIATTDGLGRFSFSNIPSGNYALEAIVPGFNTPPLNVSLLTGATASAAIRLTPGSSVSRITVVGAGSPVTKPSPSAQTGRPIRVGGNIQALSLIQQVQPVYPTDLQAAGVEGTVLVEAVIGKDGVPIDLKVRNTSVDPAFVKAAMQAVWQWRYRPAMLNGEPIEVLTTIDVDFKLQGN